MLSPTLRIIGQIVRGYLSPPSITAKRTVDITYRCWPRDADIFFHMNNSKYLQLAELSRWRTLSPMLPVLMKKNGFLFLAAENHIKYLRPINIFQRYVISTNVYFDEKDDKWIYYDHIFQEHPDDVKQSGKQENSPKTFAIVNLKAVVKEGNGKTIQPSSLVNESKFFQDWVERK